MTDARNDGRQMFGARLPESLVARVKRVIEDHGLRSDAFLRKAVEKEVIRLEQETSRINATST